MKNGSTVVGMSRFSRAAARHPGARYHPSEVMESHALRRLVSHRELLSDDPLGQPLVGVEQHQGGQATILAHLY